MFICAIRDVKCVIFSSLSLFPCFWLFQSFSVYNILFSKWVRLREETKEFFERVISSTSCKNEKLGRIIVSGMSSLFRVCYSFSSSITDVYPIKESLIFFCFFRFSIDCPVNFVLLYAMMKFLLSRYFIQFDTIKSARTNSLLYTKRICLLRSKNFCVQFNTLYVSQTVIQTFSIEKLYNRTLFYISLVREADIKVKLS